MEKTKLKEFYNIDEQVFEEMVDEFNISVKELNMTLQDVNFIEVNPSNSISRFVEMDRVVRSNLDLDICYFYSDTSVDYEYDTPEIYGSVWASFIVDENQDNVNEEELRMKFDKLTYNINEFTVKYDEDRYREKELER